MTRCMISIMILLFTTGCASRRNFWEVELTLGVEEKIDNGGKATAGITFKRPVNTGSTLSTIK